MVIYKGNYTMKPISPHYLANSNLHRENSKGNYTIKPISTHCEASLLQTEEQCCVTSSRFTKY